MSADKAQLFSCAICLDVASDPVVTRCGHLFCWSCLEQWLYSAHNTHDCPICKALVDPDVPGHIIPLYGTSRTDQTRSGSSRKENDQDASSKFTGTETERNASASSSRPSAPRSTNFSHQSRPSATNVPGPRQNATGWRNVRGRSLGVQVFCMTWFSSIGIFLTLFFLVVFPWIQSTGFRLAREWWRNFFGERETPRSSESTNEARETRRASSSTNWNPPAVLKNPFFMMAIGSVMMLLAMMFSVLM